MVPGSANRPLTQPRTAPEPPRLEHAPEYSTTHRASSAGAGVGRRVRAVARRPGSRAPTCASSGLDARAAGCRRNVPPHTGLEWTDGGRYGAGARGAQVREGVLPGGLMTRNRSLRPWLLV